MITGRYSKQPPTGSAWFVEDQHQVSPETISAFGVELNSRYGLAYEMIEMLAFAAALARENLEGHVESVFYDSNACIANIHFRGEVVIGSATADRIFACADTKLGQFIWLDDCIYGHLYGFDPESEPSE